MDVQNFPNYPFGFILHFPILSTHQRQVEFFFYIFALLALLIIKALIEAFLALAIIILVASY